MIVISMLLQSVQPVLMAVIVGVTLAGCSNKSSVVQPPATQSSTPPQVGSSSEATATIAIAADPATEQILQQSWTAYKQRFIQADGRVIDREQNDRTVSEGQAYAMLRAVLMDDPDTFDQTLTWAENNLRLDDGENPVEEHTPQHLWAWTWGQTSDGSWGVIDANFASDADLDAATALILAARRWNRPDYVELAQAKLDDLWTFSTLSVPQAATPDGSDRYLLPGPKAAFHPRPDVVYLNPSYLAPYAFRLFAQVDPAHDWLSLVDTSYQLLSESSQLSPVGLPSDWVALDTLTGTYYALGDPLPLKTVYSFDAYRVWWRVALDAALFEEPRAFEYLQTHLDPLADRWRSQQMIPATINRDGTAAVDYEATSQYGMLYPAFLLTDTAIANEILTTKLLPAYEDGFWDNDSAYYTQNLSWFGLFATAEVASSWFQP